MLLVILVAIPLIGAIILFLMRKKSINIPFIISSIVLLLSIFGLKGVFNGEILNYKIPLYGPFVPSFHADSVSVIFVILASFLWLVVSIYSPKYMEHEGKAFMFQLATLLTLFAVLGIFLAGDLFTMLLFFELMTITSYFWVIHRWNKEATKAGYFYLFFSIVGGLLIALGIVLMGAATDVLPTIGSGMATVINPQLFGWSIAIFIVGFGIKSGMVPLHLWLPYAHSVAPTPGSALLSGLIIKVGAYGLIRTGQLAGWGVNLGAGVAWLDSTLIILGTLTMLLGVLAALIQSNAKKLLAYHSISQMGYVILGLGVALYLGADGGYGLSGSIYHIINHALFKVALFLGVGVIYVHTGETDLYKLGGLWRRFPVTAILMLIAVLGITGAPGLNGYASKSLIHHGVSHAAEVGAPWLLWVERLFLVVGVGTAASFSKLYYLMFLGKKTELEVSDGGSASLQVAMGMIAVVLLGIGIRPEFLLNTAIVPAVQSLGMESITTTLTGLSFWHFKDIFDMIITLALGILVCALGLKTGAFHWHPPVWMTIEGMVGIIHSRASVIQEAIGDFSKSGNKSFKDFAKNTGSRLNLAFRQFDHSKSSTVFGSNLIGVSADIGILIIVLGFLIAWYTLTNFI